MKKVVSLILALIISVGVFCVGVSAQSTDLTVEQVLYNGVSNYKAEIYVADYELTIDEFKKVFGDTKHLYPSVFHVDNVFSYYEYNKNGETYVYSVLPRYTVTQEKYKNQLRSFNFWLDEIANKVDKDATDFEKILFVHEYFVAHFEYDTSYTIYDAYNFFKYKTGVCQAYTIAFTAVMQKLGVFCTSAIDNHDKHCWNIVKIGENYYHIDITHDDPIYKADNDDYMSDYCGRDHLLLSDGTMFSLPLHTGGWYTVGGDISCEDTSYENEIWPDYRHPSAYCDGLWYQIFGGSLVQIGNQIYYPALLYSIDKNNQKTLVETFNIPARQAGNSYYSCNYDIFTVGNIIFGGGGNYLWRYSIPNKEFKIIYNTNSNIYETSYAAGGKIKMIIENSDGSYSSQIYQLPIGDTDDNGDVNGIDLINLKKYLIFGTSEANVGFMDVNGDCFVDVLDFIAMNKKIAE